MQMPMEENSWLYMELNKVSPHYLDILWADGWRHFGSFFFRDKFGFHRGQKVPILPLRINLHKFRFSKSQQKLLKRQAASEVLIRTAHIDDAKYEMFFKHIHRFEDNVPDSIHDFLGQDPSQIPAPMLECCLLREGRMYAVSFFDKGNKASSSVYAMFDPAYGQLSPGLHTLLAEIEFSLAHQMDYVYLGYAYRESSHYDYKKRFYGLEFYDWNGKWHDYPRLTGEDEA
ncbi:hypothetical protein [Eisenibacter elegans]|jgi:arginine-tRNA-protein transferase|uniref:hypothetical protein n=1 Tax=Eisenibacter elegans TaxID=997 RepID=UPI000687EF22|nr:hypothetical protein [Eisenibacter elegans]